MSKRVVIALGGNALGSTISEQAEVVKETVKVIAGLIRGGYEVIVTHGNGPQVGMIQKAFTALKNAEPDKYEFCPLDVCAAMSQGYVGYDLTRALTNELEHQGIDKQVTMVLTRTEVDPEDPSFADPSKPIGAFVTPEQAEHLTNTRGFVYKEDAGRGLRRVVPSPMPVRIVELDSIKRLVKEGQVVICGGGGGIPVIRNEEGDLQGVEAVIDKDNASCTLAMELGADFLVILTAVEKVAINFGKPDQQWLDQITVEEAHRYIGENQFAPGSMLPKVEAAIRFAQSGEGRTALITLLEKAGDGLSGKTGTRIIEK